MVELFNLFQVAISLDSQCADLIEGMLFPTKAWASHYECAHLEIQRKVHRNISSNHLWLSCSVLETVGALLPMISAVGFGMVRRGIYKDFICNIHEVEMWITMFRLGLG